MSTAAVMMTDAPEPVRGRARPVRAAWPMAALLVVFCAAFVMRIGQFGNPIAGLDDQFYLLVGDRMWSGLMPYVDIWDRKPAGLFYLYAAVRMLPGNGVLAYQIVGTTFLALTGVVVARIGMAGTSVRGALASGLAVVVYGVLLGCGFGEAPIYYDLATAIAGGLLIGVVERPVAGERIDRRALGAMLLCGAALTVKTSAVFECCAFGLLLLVEDGRLGLSPVMRLRRAALYLTVGLAPTLLTALPYAINGGLDAFAFANFRSAFLRTGGTGADSLGRCAGILLLLSPLVLPALAEWREIPAARRRVFTAWLVAGVLSFVSMGRCFEHYALPLVTPLALLAAYGLGRWWMFPPVIALLAGTVGLHAANAGAGAERDRADTQALVDALPPSARTGCLFVYEGPTILYHLSGACLPGRYVFPGHFTEPSEEGALERPMVDVLRDTLSHRPAVIVSVPDLRTGGASTANDRILAAELARVYRPVARRDIQLYGDRRVQAVVWERRS